MIFLYDEFDGEPAPGGKLFHVPPVGKRGEGNIGMDDHPVTGFAEVFQLIDVIDLGLAGQNILIDGDGINFPLVFTHSKAFPSQKRIHAEKYYKRL